MLWAVWGHFQGGSLCLASSVCWSLQGLIATLTQVGWWWTLFFSFLDSLVQSHCEEGGMLQTNNTGVCLQCLSHTGHAPAHGTHCSGSTLVRRELSEPLGCMHLPGLSHSGSALREPSEAQIRLGLHFVPFPGLSSSGDEVFGECGHCDLSPPLSLMLGFLGVQLAHLLRQMLTVQNPKKS